GIGNFFWKIGDNKVIDGLGPNGIAARIIKITNKVIRMQTGYLYHYAFAMLIGIAALITWMMIGGVN
ncbi:MAG: NADH-quinone oxidoreductase subunit L, partial [Bartonella sp.]|nr:NADH-quinone oxidoreductase subunit L [Bartonella sp.]